MPVQDDPIKRLRTALGLKQEPFGKLFGVVQSVVSEWESGAPLAPDKAAVLWKRYGHRLRGMGCSFESLVLARNGYKPRKRGRPSQPTDGDDAGASAA